MKLEDKLYRVKFKADSDSHLIIISQEKCKKCELKQCTYVCPAECYKIEDGEVIVSFEGCLECGTCRIACHEFENIDWKYPLGGYGVTYVYG
jgi:ferredoxin like protein